ncbi:MAG: tryptophan synthase subunit alpha [Candidatus Methanoplasma sp.]|nr:tryptophan synthase subunit alpha [Candidatus Methanoplasma sp.]
MSKIAEAFGSGKALICFVTGGDPDLETTEELVAAMAGAGAAIVEIGVPFSDPVAEGPVIQGANARALASGTTLDALFATVRRIRARTGVPIAFLTYLNPVFRYGYGEFFAECERSGVDGIIVPDAPLEEQGEFKHIARAHGVDVISLIAPTSGDRVERIAREADGFVYMVSSLGVTGVRDGMPPRVGEAVAEIRRFTEAPVAIGFGIGTPGQAAEAASIADGAIVGSAIVEIVARLGRGSVGEVGRLVGEMKKAIDEAGAGGPR